MAFPTKTPPGIAQIADAISLPAGKKMSVRNMARLKPAKGPRRPKPGVRNDSESEYA